MWLKMAAQYKQKLNSTISKNEFFERDRKNRKSRLSKAKRADKKRNLQKKRKILPLADINFRKNRAENVEII